MSHDRGFFLPGWNKQPGEAAPTVCNDAAAGPRFTIADASPAPAAKDADTEPRRWRELHKCIAGLLETNCGIHISAEKRTHRRFPFHKPLTITPINDAPLTWETLRPTVAVIDNGGVVTAVRGGRTEITVRSGDARATSIVTVPPRE